MPERLSDLVFSVALRDPLAPALRHGGATVSYAALAERIDAAAHALVRHGLARGDRVAVWLDTRPEAVAAMLGAAHAGGAFVPVAPVLKARQVLHILGDCGVRVLVTGRHRLEALRPYLNACADLWRVVVVDGPVPEGVPGMTWDAFVASGDGAALHRAIDHDMAAILYTSGSTGRPKGVVLSHRNLLAGAESVAEYLDLCADDTILAVLPLSFDAGFSQLTTAFAVGARVVLLDYLLPRDVVRTVAAEGVTVLTGVPPLWSQLASQEWPEAAVETLRVAASTGGIMPRPVLRRLRQSLPRTSVYLMYGLTEAFRSTYLPPSEVDRRPDSIGTSVPNAEVLVVRPDGSPCAPGEPGELVHRGAFVALGYWNDPARTAARFRSAPGQPPGLPTPERAVWSGDTVRRDEDGYLYFVGRSDDMIKCSGYRVSPTEVEEVLYASAQVAEAAAVGAPHPELGQAVVAVVAPRPDLVFDPDALLAECRRELPAYMVPRRVEVRAGLPRTANGKIDRAGLARDVADAFGREPA